MKYAVNTYTFLTTFFSNIKKLSISEPDYEMPREFNPFGEHLKPVSSAVMLSPPVRRSRVMEPERDGSQNASMLN